MRKDTNRYRNEVILSTNIGSEVSTDDLKSLGEGYPCRNVEVQI